MQRTIIHQESWSRSVEGIPIELYKKGHTPDASPKSETASPFQGAAPILFIGGVHGDEPEGVRLAQELLSWIQSIGDTTELRPWILIPCLNVEGFRNKTRTNSRGVDLNRNFPTKHWQKSRQKTRYYTGPEAASEPEVKSLIDLVNAEKPQVIIHFHSWEPCVVYTGDPGRPWAENLSEGNCYMVKEDIGYPTPGSLGEWGWTEKRIPVVCVEEKDRINLDLVWGHFERGLKKILLGSI